MAGHLTSSLVTFRDCQRHIGYRGLLHRDVGYFTIMKMKVVRMFLLYTLTNQQKRIMLKRRLL
jgi:hypothetical protein